ncbi:MAG: phage tail tape measure protein [Nitrososphaerota archaeon]|nr:phage tail tape measure protein [Candidatus Calditenuaceae archaeon]MDW8073961.1 phage tail tape measure protein [Nitrososphaerota archaeon]
MTVSEFTLKAIFTAEDRVSGQVERIRRSFGELASAGEEGGGRLRAAMESVGRVAEIALGFTFASAIGRAAEFVRESVDVFARLERSTLQLAAATREAGQDIQGLAEALRSIASAAAREYAVTAEEAVTAMEALVKAGLGAEDTLNALGAAIMLAKNEGVSFAEAGNNLVQVLAQFGLRGDEAARVVDALTNASRLGVGTAQDFARGLANTASTAKSLGLSLEEATTWLVVLERRLGSAEEAGTIFNRFLLELADIAERLGIPLREADGTLRSMQDVILEVVAAVRGAGGSFVELQDRLSGVDSRALKALLTLSQMTESFEELRGEVSRSGAAMDVFSAALDSTAGRLERQRAEIDRWQRSIGEAVAGIYTMAAPTMLKLADAIVTPWRGIIAYFTGDEFQKLSAAVETQLHILGRMTEEESANWIMSWVEAGRITRSEALEIAGSMLSLSTIARTGLRALVEEAVAVGEEVPPALQPLTATLQGMAEEASQTRLAFENLSKGVKSFVEDASVLREAAALFTNYYDVVLAVEQALGRDVQLTEEAERSKARLSATMQVLGLVTESFGLVQQALQLYLLGGKEAGDMLLNTMTGLVAATEDGSVTAAEFRQILGGLGVDSENVAGSLHSILQKSLEAVKAAIEGNIQAATNFSQALNMLDGRTAHTYHYHHIVTVTEPARYEEVSAAEQAARAGLPMAQQGIWNVPRDMPVYLHAGEMVIPKPVADWLRRGGGITKNYAVKIVVNAAGAAEPRELAEAVSRELVRKLRAM